MFVHVAILVGSNQHRSRCGNNTGHRSSLVVHQGSYVRGTRTTTKVWAIWIDCILFNCYIYSSHQDQYQFRIQICKPNQMCLCINYCVRNRCLIAMHIIVSSHCILKIHICYYYYYYYYSFNNKGRKTLIPCAAEFDSLDWLSYSASYQLVWTTSTLC